MSTTFLDDTMAFTRRNVEHIRQIPEKLLDVTVQPVMFTLLFAFVFGGAITVDGGNYREYLIGGILVQTLTFFMMGPGMSIAEDLKEGAIDRFRSLPSNRNAYLAGHFLAELGGGLLSIAIILVTGTAIGWRPHGGLGHALEALALLTVFAAAMIWIGTAFGTLVRSSDAVQGVVFVTVFPLTFVSNAFVPAGTLPTALEWIAAWNPVSALASAVRELFGNPVSPPARVAWPVEHPVAAAWIYTLILLAVGLTASIGAFRRRTVE